MAEAVTCPFCGFKSDGEYAIQLHIEEQHTDESPFAVKTASPGPGRDLIVKNGSKIDDSMPPGTWTRCTRRGCGEYVPLTDIDDHLELHEAEVLAEEKERERKSERRPRSGHSENGRRTPQPQRRSLIDEVRRSPQSLQKSPRSEGDGSRMGRGMLEYLSGTSYHGRPPPRHRRLPEPKEPGRLGKRELGPFAFENSMPADVRRKLLNDAAPYTIQRIGRDGRLYRETIVENETSGLIRVLSDVCALDRTTTATYFCDASVKHILKIRCDGNFCGYWNIQMLLTFLQSRRLNDRRQVQRLPDILAMQDIIEQAWDNGICSYGRVETGGVRGTRKWIGSHEALAYFTQIGVKVEALTFMEEDDSKSSQQAAVALLDHIEAYFMSGLEGARTYGTSHITSLAPVYFQRFGHSMTIVGLERKNDGSRNLLVFDSSFATADAMKRLLAGGRWSASPEAVLRPYRRTEYGLSRWEEFEIVVPQPVAERKEN